MNSCAEFLPECQAWCCRGFFLNLDTPLDDERYKYFKAHGCKIITDKRIWIPLRCAFLDAENNCLCYENRPKLGQEFTCTAKDACEEAAKCQGSRK